MRGITSRVAGAAVALAVTVGGLVLAPAAAGASPQGHRTAAAPSADSCTPVLGCSQIHNDSGSYVIIRPNWECGGGTGSTGNAGCTSGADRYLWAGEHTAGNEDWDTFRVDPGWCYKVKFYLPYRSWTVKYNRSGLGETWVKVENWATAVIQAQQYGSCPA